MQPFQARRKGMVIPRMAAMMLTGRRRPRFAHLELARNARSLGIKESLRSFVGTFRRLLAGQGRD